jgi:hypothetical protein
MFDRLSRLLKNRDFASNPVVGEIAWFPRSRLWKYNIGAEVAAMRVFTAVFGLVVVVVLCNLASISILRTFGVAIPFSFPFQFGERKERNLITSLQGRSKSTYIFVSGFLLFACPTFLGLIAYDRLLPIQSSKAYYVGTTVVLVILVMGGVSFGNSVWKKAQRVSSGA